MESQEALKPELDVNNLSPEIYSKLLHDLRSPLTSILGMVEIIKLMVSEKKIDLGELEWYVQQIEQEALRMRGMLR